MAHKLQQQTHAFCRNQCDNLSGKTLEAPQVKVGMWTLQGLLQTFSKRVTLHGQCRPERGMIANPQSSKLNTQAVDMTCCLNNGTVMECASSATRTGTDKPRLLGQTGAGTYYGKPFVSHQVRLEVEPPCRLALHSAEQAGPDRGAISVSTH